MKKGGWRGRVILKNLAYRGRLEIKGNIVQIVKNEPHTEIKLHYHKEMIEIYHILKGKAIVFCGDTRVRTKPGDTLLCESREVHGVINNTNEEFQFAVSKSTQKTIMCSGHRF